MSITGKVALITGSAQGFGRAIALRLAKDGADIGLLDLPSKKDKLEAVAGEVRDIGRKATVIGADVSNRDEVRAAVDKTEKDLGGFDIMVNNAGVQNVTLFTDITPELLDRLFKINVWGVVWGIQAAADKFIARKQKGKIINASSIAGHDGYDLLSVYSATKFAVRGFTQAAAREFAPAGITVNAYCPGVAGTAMWDEIDAGLAKIHGSAKGENFKKFSAGIALGRPQYPEDVANFVSYLAGPDSDYMTGQAPLIDGGMVYR